MNNINFTGKFVKSVNIQKRVNGKHYEPLPVSLVKIDLKNEDDIKALELATIEWGEHSYLSNIYLNVLHMRRIESPVNSDVLVLTAQKENFEKLKPQEILGITQFTKSSKKIHVSYLETKFEHSYYSVTRKIDGIGKALMNEVMGLCKQGRKLTLRSSMSAKKFYEKLGLKQASPTDKYQLEYVHPNITVE